MKAALKKIKLIQLLILSLNFAGAQDTSKINKKLNYCITIGFGIGTGYPLQKYDFGIASTLEVAIQKNKSIYSMGVRKIQDFEIIFAPNVINAIESINATYGKRFKRGSFYNSINAGIGWVTSVQQGKILPGAGSGLSGGFSSSFFDINNNYEKIVDHTIGFPISAKCFWIPSKFNRSNKKITSGFGIELFININSINTFYEMNICFQFGN